jgi:HK97 family phage major capsid protein
MSEGELRHAHAEMLSKLHHHAASRDRIEALDDVTAAQIERHEQDEKAIKRLKEKIGVLDGEIKQHELLREAMNDASSYELEGPNGGIGRGGGWSPSSGRMPFDTSSRSELTPDRTRDMDGALRTIEAYRNAGELSASDADRLDELVRGPGARTGLDARYITTHGKPTYHSAFRKVLPDLLSPTGGGHGHLKFTPAEVEAWGAACAVNDERAMVIGTGSAGGFGVPLTLDPTIRKTSAGVLNPIRELATVITIATDKWQGVSSAGVTGGYAAEAAEATDDSPTLVQPTIDCARGHVFVPYSWEIGQDWVSLETQLFNLAADRRDVIDATQFLTGTGTDSPAGVLTGLTTTQRVLCGAAGFPAVGDHYGLKQAVPARWMGNATWAANPAQYDRSYRLTPAGSTTEPQMMPTREGALLGRSKVEWSTMINVSTAGSKLIIYGDFREAFTIADRIGMMVSNVPHLFGAAFRPTGQSGLYCFWRTGSKVVIPEALRYLETI